MSTFLQNNSGHQLPIHDLNFSQPQRKGRNWVLPDGHHLQFPGSTHQGSQVLFLLTQLRCWMMLIYFFCHRKHLQTTLLYHWDVTIKSCAADGWRRRQRRTDSVDVNQCWSISFRACHVLRQMATGSNKNVSGSTANWLQPGSVPRTCFSVHSRDKDKVVGKDKCLPKRNHEDPNHLSGGGWSFFWS